MRYNNISDIHLILLFFIGSNFFKYNNFKEKTGVCCSGFKYVKSVFY